MIVSLIGIVAMIIIILLVGKILSKNEDKTKNFEAVAMVILLWIGFPIAGTTIICGICEPTKIGEWEVKEEIRPTLLNDEENIWGGYTYEYEISNGGSSKPNVINYEVEYLFQNVPILVKCERKAEPTIWTLGLRYKETKYVFYSPGDTID
ncbi:MAG: hypothetical protein HFJ42_02975 [Clostridia bacterium]|nr:hypothetical protein [Clostridia bacterium]